MDTFPYFRTEPCSTQLPILGIIGIYKETTYIARPMSDKLASAEEGTPLLCQGVPATGVPAVMPSKVPTRT